MYDGMKVECGSEGTVCTIEAGKYVDGVWSYRLIWDWEYSDDGHRSTGYCYTPDQIKQYLEDGTWTVVDSSTHVKIEVLTAEFNYQGLYKGTVIDNAKVVPDGYGVEFRHNGKNWLLNEGDYLVFKNEDAELVQSDMVNKPKHYAVFEELEAIEVIASCMTLEQFYGYCLGNILKYRLRAGGKDDVMQELGKADKYQELFNTHKHLCKDFK